MGQLDNEAYAYLQQRLQQLEADIRQLQRPDGVLLLESFLRSTSILAGCGTGDECVAALRQLPQGPEQIAFTANFMMNHPPAAKSCDSPTR